jgi:hypothetical protein
VSNQLLSKGTVSAADIKPTQILWSIEPVQERFGDKATPAAHHPFVSFSVREELVSLAHWHPPGLASAARRQVSQHLQGQMSPSESFT